MLDIDHVRLVVVRPALKALDKHSKDAENLVLGTALQESLMTSLEQHGGPAIGLFQMEPKTHQDIWNNYLKYRQDLAERVDALRADRPSRTRQLATNLMYAAAMCRIHYLRVPDILPTSAEEAAHYWKIHYNSPLGKGRPHEFLEKWEKYVGDW